MPDRSKATLLAILLIAGCGDLGTGVDAYEAGRYEDAHAAFAAIEERAGESASATLLYDRSLAALRVGDVAVAESAAKRSADRDAVFDGRRDFLLGNVAYARCELAETQANSPEAEPFAFDLAIRYAEAARDAWVDAAASAEIFPGKTAAEWPAARRNVLRALAKIEDLKRQKEEKARDPKKQPNAPAPPKPLPTPMPPDPAATPETVPDTAPSAVVAELTAEQVKRLFETLAAKEKERLDVRRARRAEQPPEVTKDW